MRFLLHENEFYKIVKKGNGDKISTQFFDKIAPKLNEFKEGIWYLTGMLNDNTVDLILTADGEVQNFYVIEELISTALKPEHDIENVGINMAGFSFTGANISFYSNELKDYPDEINITLIHDYYNEENKADIINGCYLFLDNYLGELNSLSIIDSINFEQKSEAEKELIPIEK